MAKYDEIFTESIEHPEKFWADAAEGIDWYQKWDTVVDDSNPPFYRWFAGGLMNTCYNAVDRHVEAGRGDQTAQYCVSAGNHFGPFNCAQCRGRGIGW